MFDRDNSGTINHNEIKWETGINILEDITVEIYISTTTIPAPSTTMRSSKTITFGSYQM